MALQIRGQPHDAPPLCAVGDDLHTGELQFGALGRAPAQVTLATFGADNQSAARHSEPLGGCLVGLEFELLGHGRIPSGIFLVYSGLHNSAPRKGGAA